MTWCVRSTKDCVTTDVSQFLICPRTFLRFQRLYSMTLSVVIWVIGKCVQDGCPRCSQRSTKKKQPVDFALTFLMRYHKEGDVMLSHTVTGDKTWVSHITPESQQQSLNWMHTGWPNRKKFNQTFSTRQIMCTVFWNRQGVLLVEFLSQGTTMNSTVYCETLKKLRRAIPNKRHGMLPPFFCFTITLGCTLLLRLKTSSPHLSGNKWTTPRTALIWRLVIITSSYT